MNALWVMLLGLTISGVRSARAGAAAGWRHRHSLAVITGFAVGAVLFALHPLRMESVAWVSDRKDLLCAFFAVPSLIAYLAYISRSGSSSARRWYGASFILFVLAALSKSIAVVLPVIILLVDWALADVLQWNTRRKGLVVTKLPFLLVSSIITVLLLQMSPDGKRAYAVADLDIPGTILFPFYAFSFYLEKLVRCGY